VSKRYSFSSSRHKKAGIPSFLDFDQWNPIPALVRIVVTKFGFDEKRPALSGVAKVRFLAAQQHLSGIGSFEYEA